MRLRYLPVVIILLLVACGGDDDGPIATVTPSPELTPGLGAFATAVAQPATIPVQRVPVHWVPEPSPFDIANAPDPDAPFTGPAGDIWRRNPESGPDEWRVQVVEGNSAPRLLHTSRKGLFGLSWTVAANQAGLITERPVPSTILVVTKAFRWQGSVSIDPVRGGASETLNPFPDLIGTVVQGSPLAVDLRPDSAGKMMMVTFTRPRSGPGQGPTIESMHLLDAQGNSRRLEGLPDVPTLSPLPGGGALVGGPGMNGRVYLVPTQDVDALVVSGVMGIAVEQVFNRAAGPQQRVTGNRVFLSLMAAPTGMYALYDATTHSLREVGRGPWPGRGAIGTWTQSDKVIAGTEVIDVNTGRREPMPTPVPQPQQVPVQSASPDGRYVLHLVPPAQTAPSSPECEGLPSKVEVEESGARRGIYECAGGNPASVTWVDNTHAVVRSTICRGGCDDGRGGLLLIDAADGRAVPLTQGWVEGPYARPSPDKGRLLVGGDRLSVYAVSGELQRRVDAPPRYQVSSAAWSPDGTSFAYLLAPRGWYLSGP